MRGKPHHLSDDTVSSTLVDCLLGNVLNGTSRNDAVSSAVVDGLLGDIGKGASRDGDLSESVH